MPTILLQKGFRFFFYSRENNEPAHIHVAKGDAEGKIWLEPIFEVAYLIRFSRSDEHDIIEIVTKNYEYFKQRWNEHFKQ